VVTHPQDELPISEKAVMADLIYILLTLLFMAVSYGFIIVCERLMEDNP
jgi:hypothetical protein